MELIGGAEFKCPWWAAAALYKYGKARTGKQMFLCLMCGKQFTAGARRAIVKGKPDCPKCGRHMNLYKAENGLLRFRCSGYPACKHSRNTQQRRNSISDFAHSVKEK
jgi:transposase-like protein